MVRVGAKRERPCILVLHVALRAAQQPAREGPQRGREGGTSLSTSPRERFIWKTSATAEVYAKAVLRSIRAYWQLLGGVRYAGSDALTLISAVWQDIDDAALGATAAAQAGGIVEASCACVTEATVEVPVSQLVADDGSATVAADASNDDRRKRRRRRTEEDVEDVMPQTCHAAVHVTRVENVLPSRQRR
ncbi:hypothetical protein CGC21_18375 [Leishmania donovani]|uniref:Uncharacterized protein n=1 Tax=Leishmania donovani TaxID=5661 RepID=A0A504X1P9_LEIDO|nr:hypothetical protein CGC21_18375 [Leishmania donovani]